MRSSIIRTLLVAAAVLVVAAPDCLPPAMAQPTFGRPKPDRKRPAKPSQPEPSPAEPGEARPDMPEEDGAAELIGGPNAEAPKFIPSPEEWLETDPPRRQPGAGLPPGETFAWRSSDGLRFSYTTPVSINPDDGADVVIICHPRGMDFRWGMANHLSLAAAKERGSLRLAFRPSDIVVSVDGINADPRQPKRRWFGCDAATAVRFRDFVLELTRTMPARRFFLYGCGAGESDAGAGGGGDGGGGGGGQFVMYFARSFPALADGVVAYGAGTPCDEVSRSNVPVVMLHGVKNGLVPFSQALEALKANVEAENPLVRLRALRAFNDYPNPVRVSESIDWLIGARTDRPAEALAAVERMLTPKGPDEYDYVCPVWFAGAREILARILDEPGALTGEAPFDEKKPPSPEIKVRAREIVSRIDAHAAAHVAALREFIPKPGRASDLVLDGEPWLGHLIGARDDLRGVGPMEEFAADIAFDDAMAAHTAAASDLIAAFADGDDAETFGLVTATLPNCFLYEGLPVELVAKMKAWKRRNQAGELELTPDSLEGYELVTNWDEGYRRGLDAYQKVWRTWRFEPSAGADAAKGNTAAGGENPSRQP